MIGRSRAITEIRMCEWCGVPYPAYPGKERGNKRRYCATKCARRARDSKVTVERKAERHAKAGEPRVCVGCGATYAAQVKRGQPRHYCSEECARRTRKSRAEALYRQRRAGGVAEERRNHDALSDAELDAHFESVWQRKYGQYEREYYA